MALNHVLIVQPYSRRRELQESYLNIFYLPIFDRFMAHQSSKKNFGPNVIYCFLGYVWYVCIACIYCMYGMYVSYVFIVCMVWYVCIVCMVWYVLYVCIVYIACMYGMYGVKKCKLLHVADPPGGIFEKKTTCKTKHVTFFLLLVIPF